MKKRKLIIDPGHGGRDPGGGTNSHWIEKDMVLKISLYQFERFKEMGVPVQLTRQEDIYLPPTVRTNIVRGSNADDCISNHINAGGGDGVETIHSIYSEGKLADMVAKAIADEGQNLRRVFTRKSKYSDKKDYYYMHRDTGAVNTVIVEYGFADSKRDDVEQLLKDWQDYAEAVVKAYCEFAGYKYTPKENTAMSKDQGVSTWAVGAQQWAIKEGISDGKDPKDIVTREQLWTMLYRAAGSPRV